MRNKKVKKTVKMTKSKYTGLLNQIKNWFFVSLSYIGRHKFKAAALVLVVGTGIWFLSPTSQISDNNFITVPITRGSLVQVVTATGEIRPTNAIMVGSQVSGLIEEILVDFNDTVVAGQVLLRIDPQVLQATVNEARASLNSAQVQATFDNAEFRRAQTLYREGFIARAEMEMAETRMQTATESVRRAQSIYDRAIANLEFATIRSPVDGTVISRRVDRGQTVAASLQAPDLFQIAEDLTQMRIETSISEADIGVIRDGQSVTFTVDAFPARTFDGVVRQIRLSPATVSNVVIYTVIIDVDNSDLRLMPGMTAFVTISVNEIHDAWKAINAAFIVRSFEGLSDDPCIAERTCTPRNHILIERGGDAIMIPFRRGISTATETEIITTDPDALRPGDRIITGRVGMARGNAGGTFGSPMGGAGGGGMRR